MDYIQQQREKAMILTLDAEKAFDSVSWQYLYNVLMKFRFSKSIINIIKALYDYSTARIKINGHLSKPITLQRGVRQGCPWSPLLFALFLEPLAQHIRQNEKISGINVNRTEHKIASSADDILLYLKNPEKVMNLLLKMGPLSSYKLNIGKTETQTYNLNLTENFKKSYPLKWNAESINYLGVVLSQNLPKV